MYSSLSFFLSLSLSSLFLKFNERLVHERFPTTAMGFPQDQTRPTISFPRPLSAMVNLIPGKSPGRCRAFCIAITEPRMCVTFEYHVFRWIEKGVNERTSPLLKPLSRRSLLGFLAFSRGISRDRNVLPSSFTPLRWFEGFGQWWWSRDRGCNLWTRIKKKSFDWILFLFN